MSTARSRSQKRYVMRLAARTRAASMHLSEIETLATFQREDGLVITVDANGVWHNLDSADADLGTTNVTPIRRAAPLPEGVTDDRAPATLRKMFDQVLGSRTYSQVRHVLAHGASDALSALRVIDSISNGPEWRETLDALIEES